MKKIIQEGDFRLQWFKFYQQELKKITSECDMYENIQLDAMPILYCSLLNRRVINKPRKIVLSKEFDTSNPNWSNLCSIIEKGKDVTPYMSKRTKKWEEIDFLLFFSGITHLHLFNDGSGSELVFGIFTNDSFYGIYLGNHKDLYNLDRLVKIIKNNWTELLPSDFDENATFDRDLFKNNTWKYKMNLISAAGINNHQHSALMNFKLNGEEYYIPMPVFCAYENEIGYIDKIENTILFYIKNGNLKSNYYFLKINHKRSRYEVFENNNSPIIEKPKVTFSFPKKILCSNFAEFRDANLYSVQNP